MAAKKYYEHLGADEKAAFLKLMAERCKGRYDQLRARGRCVVCGRKTSVWSSGKHYSKCDEHRMEDKMRHAARGAA